MSSPSPEAADRSLFFRFRISAALLAILVAVDVGFAFQNAWTKQDHAAAEQKATQEVREILDAIDVRRSEVTSFNQRASKILDEKLKSKPPEPEAASEAEAGKAEASQPGGGSANGKGAAVETEKPTK